MAYSVFRLVIREALFHELIDRDPCAGIGQISYEPKRRLALAPANILSLLNPRLYDDPCHYEVTLCAATKGLRAGEVRAL